MKYIKKLTGYLLPFLMGKTSNHSSLNYTEATPGILLWMQVRMLLIAAILILANLLLIVSLVCAQTKKDTPAVHPGLKIGDKVPDVTLMVNTDTRREIKLSDYKGKLVILDFWATWCSACIENFDKMDALQNSLSDKLQVILVNTKSTGDTEAKVTAFFDKEKKKGHNYRMASVVADTVLSKLFPHRLLPHYVWISPDGIVKAFTDPDQLTTENIKAMLEDMNPKMALKIDADNSRPLFSGDYLEIDDLMYYSIFKKGHTTGLGSGNIPRKSGKTLRGIALTNNPLLMIYQTVVFGLYRGYTDKRIIVEVRDSSKLYAEKSALSKTDWYKENEYSYDLILPVAEAGKLYSTMLEELNKYSGYYGRIEKRRIKCLVLATGNKNYGFATKGSTPANKLTQKGNRYLRNMPVSALVRWLNAEVKNYWIIDDTGYTGNIDIELPDGLNAAEDFIQALKIYNLVLKPEDRTLDVFVLSEKPE